MTAPKNLLVIDWDFFFPMPLVGSLERDALYDWGHAETGLFVDKVWPLRAAEFYRQDLELPTVNTDWETFWDRFDIDPDAILYTDESNSGAVNTTVTADVTGDVWLYDAHHDCGYTFDLGGLERWTKGEWSCEDWMVFYGRMLGTSHLHVRYPTHRPNAFTEEPIPYFEKIKMGLDRKFDDPDELTPIFHSVFVCRSGAWVPPWCDDEHEQFVADAPVSRIVELRHYEREFNQRQAREVAAFLKKAAL